MNVRVKLLIIITFVALVPLGVLAYTTLGLHEQAFNEKLSELHVRAAKYGTKIVEANIERTIAGLRPTIENSIRWAELDDKEREGALWLLYGQSAAIVAVALLDAHGTPIAGPAHLEPNGAPPDPDHVTTSAAELRAIASALPMERVLASGLAHGDALVLREAGTFVLPVGFRVAGNEPWVVMVGFALQQTCAELSQERLDETEQVLLDGQGRKLCAFPSTEHTLRVAAGLSDAIAGGQRERIRYQRADGTEMVAAAATSPWGFHVVVAQPLEVAFEPGLRMRRESLLWIAIGALAALGAGMVLARSISAPLSRLARSADQVARGDFSARLPVEGSDELAGVSLGFNRMCAEIEQREREIRTWNEELRTRVDTQTSELAQAQRALLESQKIAAMTALAAGVAHEINNPLTGVIGLTQVLMARARKQSESASELEMLLSVEREALRVRDIVHKMLTLSQARDSRGLRELRPAELLRDAVNAKREQLEQAQIIIEASLSADLPSVFADPEQLSNVVDEIIDNATKAMRGRAGKLTISADSIDGELVRMRFADTGRGIAPEHLDKVFEPFFTTKDDWHGQGLGLTAAYRVIEAHHGTIKVDSRLGFGTTITIALPATRRGAYLQ